MPKYLAKAKTLISHESRVVDPGDVFETTFPKTKDGAEMKLGDNLELVTEDEKPKKADKKAADLV